MTLKEELRKICDDSIPEYMEQRRKENIKYADLIKELESNPDYEQISVEDWAKRYADAIYESLLDIHKEDIEKEERKR